MESELLCLHCGNPLRRYGHYQHGQWITVINCRNGALSCVQHKEVIERLGSDEAYADIAAQYGVTYTAIYKIAERLTRPCPQPTLTPCARSRSP